MRGLNNRSGKGGGKCTNDMGKVVEQSKSREERRMCNSENIREARSIMEKESRKGPGEEGERKGSPAQNQLELVALQCPLAPPPL